MNKRAIFGFCAALACVVVASAEESFACVAQRGSWKIDCAKPKAVEDAWKYLTSSASACDETKTSECEKTYFFVQAHHDFCPHGEELEAVETGIHHFEELYGKCDVTRAKNADLKPCPAVSCAAADHEYLEALLGNLTRSGCKNDCSNPECEAPFQTFLAAHDECDSEDAHHLEGAFHDFEESCEKALCNSAKTSFEPPSCDDGERPYALVDASSASALYAAFAFVVFIVF